MFKTGLLILSTSAVKPYDVLKECSEFVQKFLYVHLINTNTLATHANHPLPRSKSTLNFIDKVYSHSANAFKHLNVVFITSNLSRHVTTSKVQHQLSNQYEVILTDLEGKYDKELKTYALKYFPNDASISLKRILSLEKVTPEDEETELPLHQHTCVGGTFDRLHPGHKILLNHTLLLTHSTLTVGVTDGDINKKKILFDLMESTEQRICAVRNFLSDSDPSKHATILPITDMFGPTITDASIDCLVVSEETHKGGTLVNEERIKRGLPSLEVQVLALVNDGDDDDVGGDDEMKVSSSKSRKNLLGTLLKPPQKKDSLPASPFLIGLTGGIASGKSAIGKRLEGLGAGVVDCDALGHEAYLPGTQAYEQILSHFGRHLVNEENKLIDRKQLGAIVFTDQRQLATLNGIVWPAIGRLMRERVEVLRREGKRVVVVDAAVLLEAGWHEGVHEVWLALIDPAEAERRVVQRNGITPEKARERILSQMSNKERLQRANVVLCTQWEYDYTQKQVEKAWKLLHERM